MKPFLLALLLLLGSSVFSARYLEDSNEQMSEHRDNNEVAENERGMAEEMEDQRNDNGTEDDEQENSETREDEDEQENSETREDKDEQENSDAREEVVKIRPGQTSEKNDEERDNAEFADRRAGFEEDADDMHDSRMMDGNEGGMALDANEEKENGPDEGMFENFKRKAGEIRQENENILEKMSELEAKFDEALSSDGHDGDAKEKDLHA